MRALAVALLLSAVPAVAATDQDQPASSPPPICGDAAHGDGKLPARILKGFGTGGFKITTSSAEAQAWFDYGVQLAHAFNHEQAVQAFKEAQKRDPTCAMCVWGESWGRGPTINFGIDPDNMKKSQALADKAAVLGKDGTERERALIAALQNRYHDTQGKGSADMAYAKAMDALAVKYPDDSEIAILSADAWLIREALWNDKSHTPRAMALLEGVLKVRPNDTGAIHFYIHASEMSGVAGKAEAGADKLGELAPFAGHLVHMPAHTFFRVGRYEDAALANVKASDIDHAYAKAIGQATDGWTRSYHGHNVHFGLVGAMMAGDAKSALDLAQQFSAAQVGMKASEGWPQLSSSSIYFAWGRWEDPKAVLARPEPVGPYARAMWRYARGEAYVRLGQADKVRAEARAIRTDAWNYKVMGQSGGDAAELASEARQVLMGRAAMLEGRWREAQSAFRQAALGQEARNDFGDPPLWWFPIRRSLASALLMDGKAAEAVKEAVASLKGWPNDPVALAVKAAAERKLGKGEDADRDFAAGRKGWVGDLAGFDLKQA